MAQAGVAIRQVQKYINAWRNRDALKQQMRIQIRIPTLDDIPKLLAGTESYPKARETKAQYSRKELL